MNNTYLAHHGIKGQKWGVRRYQNDDGTLTPEGRRHYGVDDRKYFTENTKERDVIQGIKGAKVGAAIGGTLGAVATASVLAYFPPAVLMANPATVGALAVTEIGYEAVVGAAKLGVLNMAYGAIQGHAEDQRMRAKHG